MEEIWTEVKDIENYEVSDEGRVRNSKTGRILSHSIDEQGDDVVYLYDGNDKYKRKVHCLVAESYLDGDAKHSYITHADGNKRNVKANNLRLKNKKSGKKVKVLETGMIYDSISECSRDMGISTSTISKNLNYAFYHNRYGFHFEEVK